MHLFLVGMTYRTAPLAIRERLALDDDGRDALFADLVPRLTEVAAIITCNRVEVYGIAPNLQAVDLVIEQLAARAGLTPDALSAYTQVRHGDDAMRHLFRVAAGLDSQVVGEPQILGQVRQAIIAAEDAGASGPVLGKLFNFAVVAGKRARTETPISQGAGSVSHAAVELARTTLGSLAGRRCLVIGAGEMGSVVARNLVSHGVAHLEVCNRSPWRAEELAQAVGGDVVPWDDLDWALARADIAITATGSREPILPVDRLQQVMARRAERPLLLIDIAVPRDVEPAALRLPGVHLYDLDALECIRADNLRNRERAMPDVEAIIEEELDDFRSWLRGWNVGPLIRELRAHVEAIREQEVDKALRRLGHLDERDREVVLALSHGIVNKVLHTPLTRLKATGAPEPYARVVADLFGLELPEPRSLEDGSA